MYSINPEKICIFNNQEIAIFQEQPFHCEKLVYCFLLDDIIKLLDIKKQFDCIIRFDRSEIFKVKLMDDYGKLDMQMITVAGIKRIIATSELSLHKEFIKFICLKIAEF